MLKLQLFSMLKFQKLSGFYVQTGVRQWWRYSRISDNM